MKKIQSVLVAIIISIFVFLVPYAYHIDLGPGPDSLVAMLWDLRFDTPEPFYILLRPFEFFFEYHFVRILFMIAFFMFLVGKINTKYILLMGIVTELVVLIISIPRFYILNSEGDNLYPILIPIPTLLVFSFLAIYLLTRTKKNL